MSLPSFGLSILIYHDDFFIYNIYDYRVELVLTQAGSTIRTGNTEEIDKGLAYPHHIYFGFCCHHAKGAVLRNLLVALREGTLPRSNLSALTVHSNMFFLKWKLFALRKRAVVDEKHRDSKIDSQILLQYAF